MERRQHRVEPGRSKESQPRASSASAREPRNTAQTRQKQPWNGHQDALSGGVDVLDVDAQRTGTSKVIHKRVKRNDQHYVRARA
jgi:hypothetical protein